MKKIVTLLLLALMIQVTLAQEKKEAKDDIETIFSEENLKFSGAFISPELKVGNVNDDNGILLGGKMGAIFNDRFTVGLGGYGLTAKSSFDCDLDDMIPGDETKVRIGMGYGGLALEYAFFSKKAIHFSIPVLVGAGGFIFYEDDGDLWDDDFNELDNTAAFIVEPGINLELNLFKHFRFNVGASYRLVQGTSLDENGLGNLIGDDDLSDFTINASLKFGFF
ncbi:MAG: hypothetical protein V2I54_10900 [Bacteroidales bacterium]|jgi:hypothetical protein|nr:hypothetical protein [Bacteroidales bacterium]